MYQGAKKILVAAGIIIACIFFKSIAINKSKHNTTLPLPNSIPISKDTVVHLMVALCDNVHQGIVKVPEKIGNGQQPATNLYWGCAYGAKGFYAKNKNWLVQRAYKINDTILERIIYKHKSKNIYLVTDAYNGKYIKQCMLTVFKSLEGIFTDTIVVNNKTLGIQGHAKLIAYIGHNGLMDFSLTDTFSKNKICKDAMLFACYSNNYCKPITNKIGANLLLSSSHLMSPEVYTFDAALEQYLAKGSASKIEVAAEQAYHKYQKCGIKAAQKLIVGKL
jgi:hypothetical protein